MSRVSGTVELVRLMILGGELGPGERLVEVHVAERLGVGRARLREALRRLEGEGLLLADTEGGMHVIAVDRRQVAATLQVRAALESLGSGLAAARVREGRAIPEELRRLDDLASAAARAEAPDRDVLADRNLHRAIVALGGNQPCRDALNHVWDRLLVASAHGALPVHEGAAADREHRELLAAVAAGDEGEASAVARRHALAALG